MTYGDRIIGALARVGKTVLDSHKPGIEDWVRNTDTAVVEKCVALVEKEFPRQSMTERMAEGPILTFLKNSSPDLEGELDAGIIAGIEALDKAMDDAAKAGGA